MNFQVDIPSIPIVDFKDHYVLVFDLISMQDATENCHYPELVGEPLRLELNFTYPLENVTELIVLGERMSSVAVDNLVLLERMCENGFFCSTIIYQSYPSAQVSVPRFLPLRLCSNS